jgi:hypothetical protein
MVDGLKLSLEGRVPASELKMPKLNSILYWKGL